MIAYYLCSKWEMNFTHHDFVFSLSLFSKWNHAFCICSSQGNAFQQHVAKQDDEWCCLIFPGIIALLCAIVRKVLICLDRAATGITPPPHLPSISLSMASSPFNFHSLYLPHFRPPSVFPITPVVSVPSRLFLYKNTTELVALSSTLCSLFPELGRAMSCFLSVHICLGTSGQCQPFNIEQRDHHSFPCLTHLISSQSAKKEKTQIFHIKITQQMDFKHGRSETKCFIRCGRGDKEAAAWWKGLETKAEVVQLEAG